MRSLQYQWQFFLKKIQTPIPAPPASCSLNSWGPKFRVPCRSCPAPFPHHHPAACPWVTTLVPTRFTPLPALALQNSRIPGDRAKASRPPLSSSPPYYCPLVRALAVLSQSRPPELEISAPYSFLQVPAPGLAPSRLSPSSSFLLGKMEVLRAGGPGPLHFAARHQPAPSSCQI